MSRILAFDIGIKNLAWCCGDRTADKTIVRGWANENIISGDTAEGDKASNKCESCAAKAGYWHATTGKGYCVRHCPPLTPALRDLSGNLLKKIPKMDVLKELARRGDADKKDLKSKVTVLAFLESRYCFPKPPVVVKKMELEDLHDGIRNVVLKNRALFSSCSEILLENQPVLKNPVMKSVQMMLFATLRDLLSPVPKVRLVHAGRKTTGAAKGDEGYAERKNASEAKVGAAMAAGGVRVECADGRGAGWFGEQKKKSDLADCLCMVMDCPSPSKN
jgi:hypothetical protein